MAIKLKTVNGINNIRAAVYIADDETEKNNIPDEDKVQGTEIEIITGNKRYRMNSNGEWIEIIQGGGSGGSDLPDITTTDNGRVLGVVNGKWDKMDAPDGLPSVTISDSGKILQVDSTGNWSIGTNLIEHDYTITYADNTTATLKNVEVV